ncbi:MAG TPA: response regulator [Polyangiales bacterium]|jgi:two-component system chemotaxis response regulator CheY|nr:response regulator [Polyangiales bacterium]
MARTILIVDDSSAMRAFVRAALEQDATFDTEVIEAGSGFDALRLLPRHEFDMVILDINMPHIHGLELISLLRANDRYRGLPVLVISTESSERDQQRAMELGASGYLTKPFESEALLERVASLCGAGKDGA